MQLFFYPRAMHWICEPIKFTRHGLQGEKSALKLIKQNFGNAIPKNTHPLNKKHSRIGFLKIQA
jgi:hypothetical protein